MKKFFAMIMALAMVLTLCSAAFADDAFKLGFLLAVDVRELDLCCHFTTADVDENC